MKEDGDFDEFVRANGAGLVRLAYLVTGDRTAAEEAVRTALARTLPRWSRVRERDPLAHVHRMVLGARGRRGHPGDPLLDALRSLPDRERKVVLLLYFADRTEGQAAATLRCPVEAVRADAERALGRLRDLLGKEAV